MNHEIRNLITGLESLDIDFSSIHSGKVSSIIDKYDKNEEKIDRKSSINEYFNENTNSNYANTFNIPYSIFSERPDQSQLTEDINDIETKDILRISTLSKGELEPEKCNKEKFSNYNYKNNKNNYTNCVYSPNRYKIIAPIGYSDPDTEISDIVIINLLIIKN